MTDRIPDSRLVNWAADLKAVEDELIRFMGETAQQFPAATQQLAEVRRLIFTARTVLKDVVDWPVELP